MRFMQLVLEALNRSRNTASAVNELRGEPVLIGMIGARAKQTAELDHITDSLADGRDNTDSSGLGVDNADCNLVRDQARR